MGNLVKKLGDLDGKLNKFEITDIANANGQAVISSKKYDLLKVYIELKRYETYLKALLQKIKKHAFVQASTQADQMHQKSFLYSYATVNISARTVYDFSFDKQWKDLDDKMNELAKKKKERETYLKETEKRITVVDQETGEITEKWAIPKEINHGLAIRL